MSVVGLAGLLVTAITYLLGSSENFTKIEGGLQASGLCEMLNEGQTAVGDFGALSGVTARFATIRAEPEQIGREMRSKKRDPRQCTLPAGPAAP